MYVIYNIMFHICNICRPGPAPVAPLSWVRDCVESLAPEKSANRQKILLGLNFYGYDYSTSVQRKSICMYNINQCSHCMKLDVQYSHCILYTVYTALIYVTNLFG